MMTDDPISTREGNTVEDMLKEARERTRAGATFWHDIYADSEEDMKFADGNQWPDDVLKERELNGRPCLTINTIPQYLSQIKGDQRQNKPAIHVIPVDGDQGAEFSNIAGTQDYSASQVYEGLIRNIEYESNAEAHYDRAFGSAVDGGIGWLRVLAEYQSDDVFEQALRIKRVSNIFSVMVDPEAKEPDYSDANWGFVFSKVPTRVFEKKYPNATRGDLRDHVFGEDQKYWLADGHVVVAEYFTREPRDRELVKLSNGVTTYLDEIKGIVDELQEANINIVRRRKVVTHQVYWRKITAWSELEKKREWPGKTIPLVPVLGKEVQIGEERRFNSAHHHSKDSSRMQNYWYSAATERVALAPKAPWLAPWNAIKRHLAFWNRANENQHFLPYDETKSGTTPRRETPPTIPAGELQMAMAMENTIKSTMGMYDASVGARGSATSGKQELIQQRESDTGSFEFVDNLSMAIRRIGKILIETIPAIYDSERIVRISAPDGEGDFVKINQSVFDRQTESWVMFHDLGQGKFDCLVKTGPAYSTQRQETFETLVSIIQAVPSVGGLIMDKLFKFMDMDEANEISDRLKKALPPGILDPKEAEELGIPQGPPPPPPPTPEQQADMAKAQADVATAAAKSKEAEARMLEANLKLRELSMMAEGSEFAEKVRDMVAESMAELIVQMDRKTNQPPQQ
jgi:hypothetical protein